MHSLSGTLPRQHPVVSMSGLSLIPQPSYFSGPSMMGHPTLRRQSSHDMDQNNMPRILSRNAANIQYYYGWQTPPTLLSPVITQSPMFAPISTTASSMRPISISTSSTQPLTITTTANSENQVAAASNKSISNNNNSTTSGESGVGVSRTYCF